MKIRIIRERFGGMGWRAEPGVLHLGGVGTAGVEKLEFELPEEWDGMAVTLHVEQAGGKMAQRPVHAVAIELDGLTLDKTTAAVKAGESVTLMAELTPEDSTVTAVSWEVDDTTLAAVERPTTAVEKGRAVNTLIALKEGRCTVTARAGGRSAACAVTVEKAETGGDEPSAVMFAVSNPLTNVTSSRADVAMESGSAYTATLTPDEGCWLYTIQVTMANTDVTGSVWDEGTRTISIPEVTGNIIITAAAKLPMLKELPVGSVVKLAIKNNDKVAMYSAAMYSDEAAGVGKPADTTVRRVEFIVAAQNYESGLNGAGRTLLIRKQGITGKQWNTTWCTYSGSLMDNYLNGSYLDELPQSLLNVIPETKFYYTPGYSSSGSGYSGSHTVTTMSRKVFLPSCYEFGLESYGYTSANSAKYYHLEGKPFEKAKETAHILLAADAQAESECGQCCIWLRTPVLNDYASGLTGSILKQYLYKGAETIWRYRNEEPAAGDALNWGGHLVNEPEDLDNGGWSYWCRTHPAFTLPGNTVLNASGHVEEVREE